MDIILAFDTTQLFNTKRKLMHNQLIHVYLEIAIKQDDFP